MPAAASGLPAAPVPPTVHAGQAGRWRQPRRRPQHRRLDDRSGVLPHLILLAWEHWWTGLLLVASRAMASRPLDKAAAPNLQIEFASVIILNKTDLVPKAHLAKLESLVSRLNPQAHVIRSRHCQVPCPLPSAAHGAAERLCAHQLPILVVSPSCAGGSEARAQHRAVRHGAGSTGTRLAQLAAGAARPRDPGVRHRQLRVQVRARPPHSSETGVN